MLVVALIAARWRQLATLCVALLWLSGLLWGVGVWVERRELNLKTNALRHALDVHALGLRGAAEKFDYLPSAITRHPAVMNLLMQPQEERVQRQVNSYLEDLGRHVGVLALYLLDVRGLALAASNWREPATFVGQDYLRRPYFLQALTGQRSEFYGVGLTTGVPGLFIAEPVVKDKEIIGVVVVKIGLATVQSTWESSPDPVILSDERGIVFLSSVPQWKYSTRQALKDEDMRWLEEYKQYGQYRRDYPLLPWQYSVKSDGVRSEPYRIEASVQGVQRSLLAMDVHLSRLAWTLTVMLDYAEVGRVRRTAQALTATVIGLIFLGLLYWRLRERRVREQHQRAQEAQSAHTAHLTSLGEMASTLAHELNQPLMALSNFAAAARRFAEHEAHVLLLDTLDAMQAQAQRAANIVKGVRSFVRQVNAGQTRCDINDIVRSVISVLQSEIEVRKARVELAVTEGLPCVWGDRLLLEQLLMNLIMNAIQATQDLAAERRYIHVQAFQVKQEIHIAVYDRGNGVSPEVATHLFEPFFSTKPEGLGLGLKICRSIAERHGGRLIYIPNPDGGSVFTLSLPIKPCPDQ